jgi:hypothetical protein
MAKVRVCLFLVVISFSHVLKSPLCQMLEVLYSIE